MNQTPLLARALVAGDPWRFFGACSVVDCDDAYEHLVKLWAQVPTARAALALRSSNALEAILEPLGCKRRRARVMLRLAGILIDTTWNSLWHDLENARWMSPYEREAYHIFRRFDLGYPCEFADTRSWQRHLTKVLSGGYKR